jgi:hypothetical protein
LMHWKKENPLILLPKVTKYSLNQFVTWAYHHVSDFKFSAARKERNLKEKFDSLKEEGRLDQYMAKKRKHNAQRDRRHMPSEEYWFKEKLTNLLTTIGNTHAMLFVTYELLS